MRPPNHEKEDSEMTTKADTTGLEYQSPEWFEACAAIARGLREGKMAQHRWKDREQHSDYWTGTWTPLFDVKLDYRLAPEPR